MKFAKRSLDLVKLILTGKFFLDLKEVRERMSKINSLWSDVEDEVDLQEVKVSVVVPTKNESKYLPLLLSSIKRSRYKNVEVVCVDYQSTDGTKSIAELYNAKVIPVNRKGVGYADHIGVLNSSGDIIVKTDADAIFPPDLIHNAVKILTSNDNLVLYHVGHLYYDAGIIENLMAYLYEDWREIWGTTGHFIAFKKEIYGEVEFNVDADVGEDDFRFGFDVYNRFGSNAIYYDRNTYVLVSARRIKRVGLLRYVLEKGRQ